MLQACAANKVQFMDRCAHHVIVASYWLADLT
jgi:hypothetical protein